MISNYANQSLEWKQAGTPNAYNEPTYTTLTICGRKETGHKLVRNKKGEEVVSSARVFTESAVECGDLIDDRLAISVEVSIGIDGKEKYRTVYLV
jgi:hypothetical protein